MNLKFLCPENYEWRYDTKYKAWVLGRLLDLDKNWKDAYYVPINRLGRDFAPLYWITNEMLQESFDPPSVIRIILERYFGRINV